MDSLRELANLVTKDLKIGSERVHGLEQESKMIRLLEGLRNGRWSSEPEIAQELYANEPGSPAYRMLKSRTRRRLLDALVGLKLSRSEFSEYARGLYKAQRIHFWSRTCLMFGGRNIAIELVHEGLQICEKYHFTNIEQDLLNILRSHYALIGAYRQYDKVRAQLKSNIDLSAAEFEANSLLDDVNIAFARSAAERPELSSLTSKALKEIGFIKTTYSSFTIQTCYFRLAILHHQISGAYGKTLEICDEAIKYFADHSQFHSNQRVGQFYLDKLECCLYLRNFELGDRMSERCSELFKVGSNNWFIYMESYFLLQLHTHWFARAADIFNQVVTHERFTYQPQHRQEKWEIYQLYLRYVNGELSRQFVLLKSSRRAGLEDFLETVPTYQSDKRGLNVSILIIHILYLIETRQYGSISTRIDALRTYRSRHLRSNVNRQSATFFKLLELLERWGFDHDQVMKRAGALRESLASSSPDYSEINGGLQILPFDWLWDHLMESIKQPRAIGRSKTR